MIFDLAVVGGGPVGATVATALGERGFKVALIEPRGLPVEPAGPFDCRVSALTRASEQILRRLGVWAFLPQERLGPFTDMHVWERRGAGEIHFDAAELAQPWLGHIVENRVIDYGFSRRLEKLDTVTQYRGSALTDLVVDSNSVALILQDRTVHATLAIGADGSNSKLRALCGIEVEEHDYAQRAVVGVVRTEQPHRHTAWQRFLSSGPIALLPLADNFSCVVWSTSPANAERLERLDEAMFAREVEVATESRLGTILESGPRAAFSLKSLRAKHYIGDRIALVGDAAHTIHPLAGQGVNLGFYDAATLAEVITDAVAAGRNWHARSVLRRYERWRRGHNLAVGKTMDMFFSLFGSTLPGLDLLRNLGLSATDHAGPVKRTIMRHASGLEGDLPALARVPASLSVPGATGH